MQNQIKKMCLLSVFFLISSCGVMNDSNLWTDRGQVDTKLIVAYLLSDIPLPESSEILEEKTVIQGSGLEMGLKN